MSHQVIAILDSLSLTRLLPPLDNSEERKLPTGRSHEMDFIVNLRDDASHTFFFDRIPVLRERRC